MHHAVRSAPYDLCRSALCAALATLTTLGMFSLIANLMPPLVAEPLVLASPATVCVPAGPVLHAGAEKHPAI